MRRAPDPLQCVTKGIRCNFFSLRFCFPVCRSFSHLLVLASGELMFLALLTLSCRAVSCPPVLFPALSSPFRSCCCRVFSGVLARFSGVVLGPSVRWRRVLAKSVAGTMCWCAVGRIMCWSRVPSPGPDVLPQRRIPIEQRLLRRYI